MKIFPVICYIVFHIGNNVKSIKAIFLLLALSFSAEAPSGRVDDRSDDGQSVWSSKSVSRDEEVSENDERSTNTLTSTALEKNEGLSNALNESKEVELWLRSNTVCMRMREFQKQFDRIRNSREYLEFISNDREEVKKQIESLIYSAYKEIILVKEFKSKSLEKIEGAKAIIQEIERVLLDDNNSELRKTLSEKYKEFSGCESEDSSLILSSILANRKKHIEFQEKQFDLLSKNIDTIYSTADQYMEIESISEGLQISNLEGNALRFNIKIYYNQQPSLENHITEDNIVSLADCELAIDELNLLQVRLKRYSNNSAKLNVVYESLIKNYIELKSELNRIESNV